MEQQQQQPCTAPCSLCSIKIDVTLICWSELPPRACRPVWLSNWTCCQQLSAKLTTINAGCGRIWWATSLWKFAAGLRKLYVGLLVGWFKNSIYARRFEPVELWVCFISSPDSPQSSYCLLVGAFRRRVQGWRAFCNRSLIKLVQQSSEQNEDKNDFKLN